MVVRFEAVEDARAEQWRDPHGHPDAAKGLPLIEGHVSVHAHNEEFLQGLFV